jgi:hypothetical protein
MVQLYDILEKAELRRQKTDWWFQGLEEREGNVVTIEEF